MEEIYEFLKENHTYYLATVEGDQPRVRPFGTIDLFEGKLYIQTGKKKNVSRQMHANGKVEIVEIRITANSVLCGQPLSKLYELVKVKVLVCAVERSNQAYIPTGSFTLEENDNIYVTAGSRHLSQLIKNLGLMRDRVKQVMIIGGSKTAYYLAAQLIAGNMGVTIIEQNPERCRELADMLPKANIIEGDGSKQDVLDEEGISSADALVTLTDIDEENLIIALSAVQRGVPKVIAKINRTEYIDTFHHLGVDTFINPMQLTCARIVRYVRAMENSGEGSVQALHYIVGGKAEALEFHVNADTRFRGVSLAEIKLRENILIASITHGNQTIIPGGGDSFAAGDTVVVVTLAEQRILDMNDIFA